ncbi:MAG: T9SS type A sorting domain-containing protein [Candidatus Fermentibacteraceae bacterium]
MKLSILLIALASFAEASVVYDDFSDGIADWDERCLPASWYSSDGFAWCSTESLCSALVFPGQIITQNGVISAYGSGDHTFGVGARLDSSDLGVCAYISVDYHLARIRRVENGTTGEILTTLMYNFPEGDYIVIFNCTESNLTFNIEHVQSSQTWVLNAYSVIDNHAGEWGLLAGETVACWDWVEMEYDNTGAEGESSSRVSHPGIFPHLNPFTGSVMITVEGASSGSCLEVFDLSGRVVQNIDVSTGTAMFTPELPGIYLARLYAGTETTTVKLVCLP